MLNWSQMKTFISGKGLKKPTQASCNFSALTGRCPFRMLIACEWLDPRSSKGASELIPVYEIQSAEKQLCESSLPNTTHTILWADGSESAGLVSLAEKGESQQD